MLAELFGGAITTTLPKCVVDVANFRQVPDTQEVFIIEGTEQKLDQLIIIDLCEAVEEGGSLREYSHAEDLIDPGDRHMRLHWLEEVPNQALNSLGTIYAVETTKKDFVLLMCVFHVPRADTDIVVSMNVPAEGLNEETFKTLVKDIERKSDVSHVKTVGDAYTIFASACTDLKVHNWGLFA